MIFSIKNGGYAFFKIKFNLNLMLGCLLFKKFKNLMNLVHCQKQLEFHQQMLNKI